MHEDFGTLVTYSPVSHPASVGHIERAHRDIKVGLKANLHQMADKEGKNWTRMLPWVLLGKRTQYQPELDASAAEMVYGQPLKVPGDLAGSNLEPEGTIKELLNKLHKHAAKDPVPTSHHSNRNVYMPDKAMTCTHVWAKVGKSTPLGANLDGPYPILERRGKSCVLIQVGTYVNGTPRAQLQHWNNLKPANFMDEPYENFKPNLGRLPGISTN